MDHARLLVLEDGRTFRGEAYGAVGETFGEAVFNTGMTGYQETLTDPSLPPAGRRDDRPADRQHRRERRGPRVAPHLGQRLRRARAASRVPSPTGAAPRSLDDELAEQGVVGISGIDTRALTRHLRDRGAMRVGIFSGDIPGDALERVLASPRDARRRPRAARSAPPSPTSCRPRGTSASRSPPSTSASRPTPRG